MYRRVLASRPALCATALAIGIASQAHATVLLKDGFGFFPATTNNNPGTRFNAAGQVVGIGLGDGLDGLRSEVPFTSSAVWKEAALRHAPAWGFAVTSLPDPFEQFGTPSEPDAAHNGMMALIPAFDRLPLPGNSDVLLDFTPPPTGGFEVSLDAGATAAGKANIEIGFTSQTTTLFDNFEQFGQASLVLNDAADPGTVATWTLRTGGLTGPTISGTTVLGFWNPLALSYDPATQTVRGSVNGVLTAPIHFAATGIKGVGFEGASFADNFIVQTGALQAPVLSAAPEPASWALMILGFGGMGALLRRRRAALA